MNNDPTPPAKPRPRSFEQASTIEAQHQVATSQMNAGRLSLVILSTLAVLYTLHLAAAIVLPLLLAVVLNLLLAPSKRLLVDRLRLPSSLAALLLILALFAVITAIGLAISLPASSWASKSSQVVPLLQQRLGFLSPAIEFAQKGLHQLQHIMESGGAGAGDAGQPAPPMQQVQQPSNLGGVGITLLEGTGAALGQVLILLVTLFFLLSSGDSLMRNLVEVMPTWGDKRRVVEIAREIERNISGYLLTITMMNALVGIANGISMWAQGVPNPLLWGTLAFLLNYIPLIGPALGILIFFFVGLFSNAGIWGALLPPAIYLLIHVVEGETVTPMLMARRFTLNPVLVIVALFFWDWMWGVTGALLAVPLLAVAKIVCDRVPTLTPIGHLLGGSAAPRENKVAA